MVYTDKNGNKFKRITLPIEAPGFSCPKCSFEEGGCVCIKLKKEEDGTIISAFPECVSRTGICYFEKITN